MTAAETHRAVVRTGTAVAVRRVTTPRPGPGELLIAPRFAGLCGTDLQMLRGLRTDPAPVIGHEGVAVVVAAGPGTDTRWTPGTQVMVNPTHPADDTFLLGHVNEGLMQERVLLPAAAVRDGLVLPIDAPVTPEAAALAEPLAVVRYALSALAARPPATLLVYGDGTVGHLAVRAARHWLGRSVRTVLVHHTERGLAWSRSRPTTADHLLLNGDDSPETLRALADGRPLGVILATPRDATLGCLASCLRADLDDTTVDLLGGLPPHASSPRLPDVDLVAVRAANRAGRPDPPRTVRTRTPTGRTVRLFGHRGVGSEHIRASATELTERPDDYRDLVTHVVGPSRAAAVMADLAGGGERVVDGERLVKLAVRFPPPPVQERS